MKFCSLYSGSSGNSMFISSDKAKILVDVGMAGKHIDSALKSIEVNPKDIDGIFITHEHIDHIKGAGILSRKYDIPIYANSETWCAMERSLGKVKEENIKIISESCVTIKDMDIVNYPIPHDAANPMGYTAISKEKRISIATDMGCFTQEIKKNIEESQVILLESNHDVEMLKFGPYPYSLKRRILSDIGHLSNDACGNAIMDILKDDHKTIILGHLSNTNNHPDLAYQTVATLLEQRGVVLNKDVTLSLANRNEPSSYIEF